MYCQKPMVDLSYLNLWEATSSLVTSSLLAHVNQTTQPKVLDDVVDIYCSELIWIVFSLVMNNF